MSGDVIISTVNTVTAIDNVMIPAMNIEMSDVLFFTVETGRFVIIGNKIVSSINIIDV